VGGHLYLLPSLVNLELVDPQSNDLDPKIALGGIFFSAAVGADRLPGSCAFASAGERYFDS
jgi:hypothetical protein